MFNKLKNQTLKLYFICWLAATESSKTSN